MGQFSVKISAYPGQVSVEINTSMNESFKWSGKILNKPKG